MFRSGVARRGYTLVGLKRPHSGNGCCAAASARSITRAAHGERKSTPISIAPFARATVAAALCSAPRQCSHEPMGRSSYTRERLGRILKKGLVRGICCSWRAFAIRLSGETPGFIGAQYTLLKLLARLISTSEIESGEARKNCTLPWPSLHLYRNVSFCQ
jgi:hypothetical protein